MRGRSIAAVVVAALGALSALACSLLVDTADLAGPAGGPGDAEARSLDAASDSPADAGAGDATKKCDATFCDDFDDGPLGGRWTTKTVESGGAIESTSSALSPPNALRIRLVDVGGSPSDRTGALERDLGPARAVRCSFSTFIASGPSADFIDMVRIRTRGADLLDYQLLFAIDPKATFLRDDAYFADGGCGCPANAKNTPPIAHDRWVRVALETDFKTTTLSFDGSVVLSTSFVGFVPTANVLFALGAHGYGKAASDFRFDDVVCTTSP